MDLPTLNDYSTMVRFADYDGSDVIALAKFKQLLQHAEQIHHENQWLYAKLNSINEIIVQTIDMESK